MRVLRKGPNRVLLYLDGERITEFMDRHDNYSMGVRPDKKTGELFLEIISKDEAVIDKAISKLIEKGYKLKQE